MEKGTTDQACDVIRDEPPSCWCLPHLCSWAASSANNVQQGSPEYVACRKDRDVQRSRGEARADRAQHNLGEYMLNNPVRP